MKKVTLLLGLVVLGYVTNAQKVIDKSNDFEQSHGVDKPLLIKQTSDDGFLVVPMLNPDGRDYVRIGVATNSDRVCIENSELSIIFEDDERIDMLSFNKFNCKGLALFMVADKHRLKLDNVPIKAIRFKNGYNGKSTQQRVYSDYFIQLNNNLK